MRYNDWRDMISLKPTDHKPRLVGSRFRVGEDDYRVVVSENEADCCNECAFYRKHCTQITQSGSCLPEERPDGKQVVFVRMKKRSE